MGRALCSAVLKKKDVNVYNVRVVTYGGRGEWLEGREGRLGGGGWREGRGREGGGGWISSLPATGGGSGVLTKRGNH